VIIAYLTGQRPGETANLERGCLTRDAETGLVLLHGRHFKGATGDDGSHLPEGKIRDDPWVTVEPVATAVTVAGRLHDVQLLFPNTLLVNGSACSGSLGDRVGRAEDSRISAATSPAWSPGSTTTAVSMAGWTPSRPIPPALASPRAGCAGPWPGSSSANPAAWSPPRSSTGTSRSR
jgi:hypothetical protein